MSLLAIVLVLVVGKFVVDQWTAQQLTESVQVTMTRIDNTVRNARRQLTNETLDNRISSYRKAPIAAIDIRLTKIALSIKENVAIKDAPLSVFEKPWVASVADQVTEHYKRKIAVEILRQEQDYLMQLRTYVAAALAQSSAVDQLEHLRLAQQKTQAAEDESRRQLKAFEKLSALEKLKTISMPALWEALKNRSVPQRDILDQTYRVSVTANTHATDALNAHKRISANMTLVKNLNPFALNQKRIDIIIMPLGDELAEIRKRISENWLSKLINRITTALPFAVMLLASSIFGHFAIKALFYYMLAPLAGRLKPICLDPNTSGKIVARASAEPLAEPVRITSAISQEIQLAPDEHLLVLPDYIQSASVRSIKDTKWMLDWTCPLTSMASGMMGLTRIRSTAGDAVVVSSANDPLSEIALIPLPAGSAMVFKPRGMVGVIYHAKTPLKISRHWRLGSLHAWLTLQLRYLVFRGPVTLLVKGSRGVRVEPAGRGRTIKQTSTLGFSANLQYQTIRCEPFYPFYQNKGPLLDDIFTGPSGYYVYDETPSARLQGGPVERSFEALVDAVLKVFGVWSRKTTVA